jgi:hypothetical protein
MYHCACTAVVGRDGSFGTNADPDSYPEPNCDAYSIAEPVAYPVPKSFAESVAKSIAKSVAKPVA